MTKYTALVLAGSRGASDGLSETSGVAHKALIEIGGRSMLERVVETLLRCGRIGDILVSITIPETMPVLPGLSPEMASGRVRLIPASHTPSQSVMSAIQSLENGWPVLVTTADHPLLSDEMINYLLDHAPGEMTAVAGIVEQAVIEAAYPQTSRTYLRFRDIAFSGANLFLLRNPEALGVVRFWRLVEDNRKHPLRLIAALGIGIVLRFVSGRLYLGQALQRLGRKCGARIGVVRLPYAEAAIDVDKVSDLVLVREILG